MSVTNTAVAQLAMAFAGVAKRALIFEYPIREMQRRCWIKETNDSTELEDELCRFFGVSSLEGIAAEVERSPLRGRGQE